MNPVIHLVIRLIIGPEPIFVHISAGMTLDFFIFWKKETIVKLFLYKTERNFNVFNSRSNFFRFKSRDTTCVILPMYCSFTYV